MSDGIQGRPPLFSLPDEVLQLVLLNLPLGSLINMQLCTHIARRVRYGCEGRGNHVKIGNAGMVGRSHHGSSLYRPTDRPTDHYTTPSHRIS